jgi:hypothetical protein
LGLLFSCYPVKRKINRHSPPAAAGIWLSL